eukprot:295413-Chlamydomonas_euryale.AAC.1
MRQHACVPHIGPAPSLLPGRERVDVVVASIYVNPTQFSANEDFDVYPRQVGAGWQAQPPLCLAVGKGGRGEKGERGPGFRAQFFANQDFGVHRRQVDADRHAQPHVWMQTGRPRRMCGCRQAGPAA